MTNEKYQGTGPAEAGDRPTEPEPTGEKSAEPSKKPEQDFLVKFCSTLVLVFKCWIEEPIGIFFALLIFFALRLPAQIPDMLTQVIVWDSEICANGLIAQDILNCFKGPEHTPAFVGFALSALTLASIVWLWVSTVNRTELMLPGGQMNNKSFGKQDLRRRALPFRLAAATAACMIVFACVAALFGPLMSSIFSFRLGILFEFLSLLAISLFIGYLFVSFTRDGILEAVTRTRNTYNTLKDLRKERDYLVPVSTWSRVRKDLSGKFWDSRVTTMPFCMWMLRLRGSIFWIALIGGVLLGIAITQMTAAWTGDTLRQSLSILVLFFCVTVICASFLNICRFAHKENVGDDSSDPKFRLSAIGIGLAVALFALFYSLFSEDKRVLRIFDNPASVALLAIVSSIGPLVIILSLLRDLAEILFVCTGKLFEFLRKRFEILRKRFEILRILFEILRKMFEIPRKLFEFLKGSRASETGSDLEWPSNQDGAANALREVGRGVALVVFLLLLGLAPLDFLTRPDCSEQEPFCKLYMVRQVDPASEKPGDPRTVPGDARTVQRRPGLEKALKDWAIGRKLLKDGKTDPTQEVPVIVVAAAGGASRAAAWTLMVMRKLQTGHAHHGNESNFDAFSRHFFAFSSVSGGSLAAVTYALYEADNPGMRLDETYVTKIAKSDLLSASMSRIFFVDVLRRLDLFRLMAWLDVDDRNVAMERIFEAHWVKEWKLSKEKAQGGLISLGASIKSVDGRSWPRVHLLLNGVDVKSGQRIVTSTLDLRGKPSILPSSFDFFAEFGRDVPLATAVMNSARFPLISPAGLYRVSTRGELSSAQQETPSKQGFSPSDVERQIIDGGYFENNGVETALEPIDAIEALDPEDLGFTPVPVLVAITNEAEGRPHGFKCGNGQDRFSNGGGKGRRDRPRLLKEVTLTCSSDAISAALASNTQAGSSRVPELLAPVLGAAGIRAAHASEAMLDARAKLCPSASSTRDRGAEAKGSLNTDDAYPSDWFALAKGSVNTDDAYPIDWVALKDADRLFHIPLAIPMCHDQAAPMNWVLHEKVATFFKDVALNTGLVHKQADKIRQLLKKSSEMRELRPYIDPRGVPGVASGIETAQRRSRSTCNSSGG